MSMNREERLDWLCRLRSYLQSGMLNSPKDRLAKFGEALDYAIDDLDPKKQPVGDLISRKAVLDEMYLRKENGDQITAGFIKKLPAIDAYSWILILDDDHLPDENLEVLLCYRRFDDEKDLYAVTKRMDYNYWHNLGRELIAKAWIPLSDLT